MNQVARRLRDPYFSFPRDLTEIPQERSSVVKGSDEHEPRLGAGEEGLQFSHALRVDRPVAGDGLDQKQPLALPVVDDDIRHLAVFIDGDPELGRKIPVEKRPLGARVAHVPPARHRG